MHNEGSGIKVHQPSLGEGEQPQVEEVNEKEKLDSEVLFNLRRAMSCGVWMVAIFRVENDKTHIDWKTSSFPRSNFIDSIELLAKSMKEDSKLQPGNLTPANIEELKAKFKSLRDKPSSEKLYDQEQEEAKLKTVKDDDGNDEEESDDA